MNEQAWKISDTKHGRGMVATRRIPAGTVLTRDEFRAFDEPREALRGGSLYEYWFVASPRGVAVVFGPSSLVNHAGADRTNARMSWWHDFVDLVAVRDIAPGEEVLITYANPEDYPCLED